jgi:hypothetical protein
MTQSAEIIIYEGDARVEVHLHGETVWLTQAQMAELFSVQKAAISAHLKNIFASGELDMAATVSKMERVQTEGRPTSIPQRHRGGGRRESLLTRS